MPSPFKVNRKQPQKKQAPAKDAEQLAGIARKNIHITEKQLKKSVNGSVNALVLYSNQTIKVLQNELEWYKQQSTKEMGGLARTFSKSISADINNIKQRA